MRFYLFVVLVSLFQFSLFAQQKHEYERDIAIEEVPAPAVQWFQKTYAEVRKLSWYMEKSEDGTTFEAKCKYHGRWHSVEFEEDGTLMDVEITIKDHAMEPAFRKAFHNYLKTNYLKTKVLKIQLQYSGDAELVAHAIQGKKMDAVVRYEIEYFGKDEESEALWEGLFGADGKLIQKREIIVANADNLTY